MFQGLLDDWKNTCVKNSTSQLSQREENLLESFAIWLDLQDNSTPYIPARNEQTCSKCKTDCLPLADGLEHFCPVCGESLGISERIFE